MLIEVHQSQCLICIGEHLLWEVHVQVLSKEVVCLADWMGLFSLLWWTFEKQRFATMQTTAEEWSGEAPEGNKK